MNKIILLLILILMSCKNQTEELPVLSFSINENGKKEFYTIGDYSLTNQHGKQFTNNDTFGKVYIANFFFTRCPSICPPMRNSLIQIAEKIENNPNFIIVSHTIDPENDTISVLKEYAESTGISPDKWIFLTGDKSAIVSLAKKYMTSFKKTEDSTDFYHSSFTMLVDKKQYIRGFYNTLIDEDMKQLQSDIQQLLKEKADL